VQGLRQEPAEVLRLTEKLFEAGVDMFAIADTVGYAGPKQLGDLVAAAVKIAGKKPICIHLHDTRGMGIAKLKRRDRGTPCPGRGAAPLGDAPQSRDPQPRVWTPE
jgi:hydroxymethylglutaryl-coenzyme A lyase family protein